MIIYFRQVLGRMIFCLFLKISLTSWIAVIFIFQRHSIVTNIIAVRVCNSGYNIIAVGVCNLAFSCYRSKIGVKNPDCNNETRQLNASANDLVTDIARYRLPLSVYERNRIYQDIVYAVFLGRQDRMRGFLPYLRLDFSPLRSRI